ncbi:SLAM family member 5-like isoform X2 [Diceros bicornis minor]|uniref:SLAM family member 5-like isoform X2 n=1 Tax=Diceros bicornis minor TaxID=77932 RepID=UPI0026EA02F8|nr:SLAM family member 5-like isoform X2 [Diceros bicornis minor]
MGPCSADAQLCWASWLLGLTSLLLSMCSTGGKSSGIHGSGGQDSGVHVPLKRIRGGSVLFHVIKEPGVELEEISWSFGPGLKYRVLLRVHNGSEGTPTWVNLQDKYKQRVHVPNMTSLRIENLTPEDSGYYRARASFTGGVESTQIFHLTVNEPVPHPQILVRSLSITAGWCNVTLECRAVQVTEDLNVTWESKGLPRELEWRETLGPAPNSWTLTVSLPLNQPNVSLTCVVSNAEDQKTVTSALGEVCAHGAELQEEHRNQDGDIRFAELSQQESRGRRDKGVGERHLEQKEPLTTVYCAVQRPGLAMKMI